MSKLLGTILMSGGSQLAGLVVAATFGSLVAGGPACIAGLYVGYQMVK